MAKLLKGNCEKLFRVWYAGQRLQDKYKHDYQEFITFDISLQEGVYNKFLREIGYYVIIEIVDGADGEKYQMYVWHKNPTNEHLSTLDCPGPRTYYKGYKTAFRDACKLISKVYSSGISE